jgi:hypothetical protein
MATGAVLAWAVHVNSNGFDVNTVGVILFVVGVIGMLATLIVSLTLRDRDYGGYASPPADRIVERPVVRDRIVETPARERIVERERF